MHVLLNTTEIVSDDLLLRILEGAVLSSAVL
jgi:hypothetical protein